MSNTDLIISLIFLGGLQAFLTLLFTGAFKQKKRNHMSKEPNAKDMPVPDKVEDAAKEAERLYPISFPNATNHLEVSNNKILQAKRAGFIAGANWHPNAPKGDAEYGEWQLCPKCFGDGNLLRYNSPAMMGTNSNPTCNVCQGSKIIAKPIIQK